MTGRICSNPGCSEPQARISKCLGHARAYSREYQRRQNGYYDKVTCPEDGCRRKPAREGRCQEHAPRAVRAQRATVCLVPDCSRSTRKTSYCEAHHKRRLRGTVDCEVLGCLRVGRRGGWCHEHEPCVLDYFGCRGCGSLLVRRAGTQARLYCTDACCDRDHRRVYRRRRRARGGERIRDREVYERDNWRCGLCHRVIHQHLAYPHPGSASIDHVLPLSEGGTHTYANVQAAHLRCNVAKLNGLYQGEPEQLRLTA